MITPGHSHFNPRSPCGERPDQCIKGLLVVRISIHAPRVGSDSKTYQFTTAKAIFQSTLPVWGATMKIALLSAKAIFQSTLPVWGATITFNVRSYVDGFQSTLPVWGATSNGTPMLM